MTSPQRRCGRGTHCRRRTPEGEPAWSDRVFCEGCEHALAMSLHGTAAVYAQLRTVAPAGGVLAAGRVSGTRYPPVPIDVAALSMCDDVEWMLSGWEEIVRDHADLTVPAWDGADPRGRPRRARQGTVVATAASTLRTHQAAWLSIGGQRLSGSRDTTARPDLPFTWRVDRLGSYTVMTGADAAGWLLDWHHQARSRLGLTRQTHAYRWPCPQCDVLALERASGDDWVTCRACGAGWRLDDFDRYVPAWAAAAAGA